MRSSRNWREHVLPFAVFAVLLMVPLVAECKGAQEKAPASDATYRIQYMREPLTTVKTSTETPIGKALYDKFHIEFEFLPTTGDQREKQNLMLAAGDYPEILRLEGLDIYQKYVQAGALVALDDYMKDSPNFTKRFAEQIPYWRLASADGKIYKWEMLMPQEFEVAPEVLDVGVRTDALEKQGWPALVSEDQWFDFLKKALAEMPETNGQKTLGMVVPLAESWGMPGLFVMVEKGGTYVDQSTNDAVIWNQVAQKWEHMFTNEATLDNFYFFNRLYRAGILDKDCFTDFFPQVAAKLQSGRALSVWYTCWDFATPNAALVAAGHPEMQYINLPVRSNAQVAANLKRQIRIETTRSFDNIVISKNCKDPKRLFAMVDWCVSEEGQVLLQSGIKGVHYDVLDGKRTPTAAFVKGISGGTTYLETNGFGLFNFLGQCKVRGADGIAYSLSQDAAYMDDLFLTSRQKEAFAKLGWKNSHDYWLRTGVSAPNGLAGSCVLDPSSEAGTLNQKLTEFRVDWTAKLVTAPTEADYNKLLSQALEEYKKLDPDRVVDAYNALLAENKAKLQQYLK